MRQKPNPHLTPFNDLRQTMPDSGDVSQFSVTETKNVRRKRLKIRQLKFTCQTKVHVAVTGGKLENSSDSDDDDGRKEIKKESSDKIQKDDHPVKISVSLSSSSQNDTVLSSTECLRRFDRGSFGVLSVIGRRREMEDAVKAELGFAVKGGEEFDFFAVYDGHGGSHVATACSERLHEVIAEEILLEKGGVGINDVKVDWEKVMEGCFSKMDEELSDVAAARTVGSTAVVALVAEGEVVVANCGDCRAVMSRAGVPLPLSTDHKVTIQFLLFFSFFNGFAKKSCLTSRLFEEKQSFCFLFYYCFLKFLGARYLLSCVLTLWGKKKWKKAVVNFEFNHTLLSRLLFNKEKIIKKKLLLLMASLGVLK